MALSARTRRVVALTITVLLVLPLSLVAAKWQWERHLEKERRNALLESSLTQAAVPVESLADVYTPELEWRQVTAMGTWTADKQAWWRKQPMDGQPGFVRLALFRLQSGKELIVELGWSNTANSGPALESDLVQLRGLLRNPMDCPTTDPADLPAGQTNCPRTLHPDSTWPLLQSSEAPDGLIPLALPEPDAGPHLGYVGQWLLIGLTAIITYISLMRKLDEGLPAQASATKSA